MDRSLPPVLPTLNCTRVSLALLCLITVAVHSGAAEKLDLKRIVPVPADQQIPIMDFFRPRLLQQPQLNLSGTHIAALVTVEKDRHELLVYDLDKKTMKTMAGSGEKDIYSFNWLNDQWLVFMLSTEKLYGLGMVAVNIRNMENYPLLQYAGASLVSIPERNRLLPLVWMRSDSFNNGRDAGVAEIKVEMRGSPLINLFVAGGNQSDYRDVEESNAKHVISRYPVPSGGFGTGYAADRSGELAYAFTTDNGFSHLHRWDNGKWIKSPADLDLIEFRTAGNNPGEAIVSGLREAGKPRPVQIMDVATGKLGDVILQDKGYDFDGWFYRDQISREIVGAIYNRGGPHVTWFDDNYRAAQKLVDASFPGQVARIIDGDKTGRLLISTFSDRQPPVYHWVDLGKRSAGLIKNSAPWIDPQRMQPMRIMAFKTRDGRKLDAYVTLPEGASKTNPAPLVVLPHGGPWARDTWGFNGEAQFLASRGYAVMQPNYRGSTSYDWMFPEEDRYDFRKMHDDVTDATRALLATGTVDAGRVAIMGTSFGAYLALSGVASEPGLYRCAVTIAGVFDWEQVMKSAKYYQHSSGLYDYLVRRLGDPKKQKDKFDAISPVRHVDKVKVPVFVSHGKEDRVAEIAESRRLIAELKKHNVPHESLLVSGEGHGMANLRNEVELYGRIETFLGKNLAPAGARVSSTTP